ncbi:aromatic ring-hydroxylating dioxygenase subunit alpha [Allocoleopsis franciscana]|uniref:Ring-hydroxylating dioxygenase, large terminal subunit n=1 Tax=Allocoleopsis franciscana PCC 7113 TaxID=1173027 RepID=K9WHV1_9CYAN|nr:Rieske 2Fe-2S domain-containing protein [Allocoleopsis franciscana]AFZ19391.1 ring-hydroxylating dioxygenase, large terminal subunit [Allocoleopsis franciscana PCC 7113]
MTVEIKTPQAAQPTATLPLAEQEEEFNWRQCWYPVTFVQDLPENRPYSFSLYDEPFVLFRNQDKKLICLTDRCPHRAAKLSDGQILDGKIECLYHGWQFGSEGQCLHIPQLPTDAKIPIKACVQSFKVIERQGMIWMWAGNAEAADEDRIPTIPKLGKPGFVYSDKITELSCDISYVIEHMLDPAHIHIAHHGNQGNREKAQPLEMEIIESSVEGFRGRFRETRLPDQTWRNLDFIVPSLAHLHFPIPEKGWFFGQAFYFFPLGKGRCRILTRSYRNFVTLPVKLMPRWWIHLKQNKILEEDLAQLLGQQQEVERLGQTIKQVYAPIETCDTFAIAYRQWVDRYGSSLPFYRGYTTSKVSQNTEDCQPNLMPIERSLRHTELCSSCHRAYQLSRSLKQTFVVIAIFLAALAIITDDSRNQLIVVLFSLSAVALAALAEKLKTKFERF